MEYTEDDRRADAKQIADELAPSSGPLRSSFMHCLICDCTDMEPCEGEGGPCHWVCDRICSACAEQKNNEEIDAYLVWGRVRDALDEGKISDAKGLLVFLQGALAG